MVSGMTSMQFPLFLRSADRAAGIMLVGLIAALTGCTTKYADLKNFVPAHDQDVASTSYRIEVPDVVAIDSPTAPEIDGEIQSVRSDGKISLRLLGEVKVSELTPRELAAKLEHLLTRYYVDPKVSVQVAGCQSKKIYVFGQVAGGGAMPFTGRDTVLDVLAKASPTFLAWGSQVKVIRPNASPDERHEVVLDIDKMMQTGDLQSNFLLKEGDIIYVPPTPLAWFGLRVRELLWPFQPVMEAYDNAIDVKDAPDRWKYGRYGYRYNSSDENKSDVWLRRAAALRVLR